MKHAILFLVLFTFYTPTLFSQDIDTVYAYDSYSLIDVIENNTHIILSDKYIDLNVDTYLEGENFPDYKLYKSQGAYLDFEYGMLHLNNFHNLSFEGITQKTHIRVYDNSTVIQLVNCQNIAFKNLMLYHQFDGCIGNVVTIDSSENIQFNNVGFNGTGWIGIYAQHSKNIYLKDTHFFYNTEFVFYLSDVANFEVIDCKINDNDISDDIVYLDNVNGFLLENTTIFDNDARFIFNWNGRNNKNIKIKECFIYDNNASSAYLQVNKEQTLSFKQDKNAISFSLTTTNM